MHFRVRPGQLHNEIKFPDASKTEIFVFDVSGHKWVTKTRDKWRRGDRRERNRGFPK